MAKAHTGQEQGVLMWRARRTSAELLHERGVNRVSQSPQRDVNEVNLS